jgi:hypothetical protein
LKRVNGRTTVLHSVDGAIEDRGAQLFSTERMTSPLAGGRVSTIASPDAEALPPPALSSASPKNLATAVPSSI